MCGGGGHEEGGGGVEKVGWSCFREGGGEVVFAFLLLGNGVLCSWGLWWWVLGVQGIDYGMELRGDCSQCGDGG